MPCPYANVLGVPREGFHSKRVLGFAVNDIVGTFALAGITSITTQTSLVKSTVGWFVLGEVLHYAFGVRTHFLEMIHLLPPCATEKSDR